MGKKSEGGYYAVIPAVILFHEALSANAKLLYCVLTNLCDRDGYCWATNEYLSELFGTSESSVTRWISQLEALGFIRSEMVPNTKGSERRIYAGIFVVREGGVRKNADTPVSKNAERGVRKNADTPQGNIFNINNQTVNNPPIVPQEGTACDSAKKTKAKSRDHKDTAEWKSLRFEGFWKYYRSIAPKVNSNRQATIRAWDKLKPSDELIDIMGQALKRFAATDEWKRGIGIPYAATWINQRRWEDAEYISDPEDAQDSGERIIRPEDSPWYRYKKEQENGKV